MTTAHHAGNRIITSNVFIIFNNCIGVFIDKISLNSTPARNGRIKSQR